MNGFLNSAEQPFAKACGTSVLLSRGLIASGTFRPVAGSYGRAHTQHPPPSTPLPHTNTHSLHVLFSVRSVDGFQCDATALPIHCYQQEMLTRITSLAAHVVGPAQDCPASSHSKPLPHSFTFAAMKAKMMWH